MPIKSDDPTSDLLTEFLPLLAEHIDGVLDDFYQNVRTNLDLGKLFTNDTMAYARLMQKRHWLQHVFSSEITERYLRQAKLIGLAHARVGLEPHHYLDGYCFVLNRLVSLLAGHFSHLPKQLEAMTVAINRSVFRDMGLAISAYIDATREKDQKLIEIGIALSQEQDHDCLLEMILLGAKNLTNADGGTVYLHDAELRQLRFSVMRNDSMGTALGGSTGKPIPFPPQNIYDPEGLPNHKNVSTHVAITRQTIHVPDVYDSEHFDFTGPKTFDARTGYRTLSLLTVPLKSLSGETLGVLQLINSRRADGSPAPFPEDMMSLVEAFASQAAVVHERHLLLGKIGSV